MKEYVMRYAREAIAVVVVINSNDAGGLMEDTQESIKEVNIHSSQQLHFTVDP